MHADEVDTDVELVRRLLAGQFPHWAELAIDPVVSYGTDHDIYRLGDHLAARLPRIAWATDQAAKEAEWLPRLAPQLPLAFRCSWRCGYPAEGYPFEWSVYEWLPGENANDTIDDLDQAAVDLAAFVIALRQVDTAGAHPRPPRWSRRTARGGWTSRCADRSPSSATESTARPLSVPGRSRSAPPWDGEEVWVHGDLLPGNLLVVDGRLSAVIDFGGLNVGDPACDLQPAWNVFAGGSRARFRAELAGRRCVLVARPRLGALPGRVGAAVLLGHQPRHDPPGVTRAGAVLADAPPNPGSDFPRFRLESGMRFSYHSARRV